MAIRTSDTHPIYVDWFDISFPGRLGMTLAPGTQDQSSQGPRWERDIEKDLARLASADVPAHVLVSLLEEHELQRYGITALPSSARRRGLELIEFPIPDMQPPASLDATATLVADIRSRLRAGKNVVVHCRGGIGRTGTIVGCVLAHEGIDAEAAFALMQKVRKERVMPQTEPQREFVRAFVRSLRKPSAPTQSDGHAPFDLIDALLAGTQIDVRARSASQPGARDLVAAAEAAVQRDPGTLQFDETGYAVLEVAGRRLSAGRFRVLTVGELRATVKRSTPGTITVSTLSGASPATDIGSLQAFSAERTLFQAASQFNCLEAIGASLTKVSNYFSDSTQGPRASISAFPGTLLRHYAAPDGAGGRFTQTAAKQVDLLSRALPAELGRVESGYLMTHNVRDLAATAKWLEDHLDEIAVGVHDGVQVVFGHDWSGAVPGAPRIAQVFTSSLAAGSYSRGGDPREVAALCRPLLRAAYLGTLLAAASLGKRRVVLTLIGGGVFGNPAAVIWDSIFWAVDAAAAAGVTQDVIVNAHGSGVPEEANRRCLEHGGRSATVR